MSLQLEIQNVRKPNFSSLAINIQFFDKDRIKWEESIVWIKLEDILAPWKTNEITKCVFYYNRKSISFKPKIHIIAV